MGGWGFQVGIPQRGLYEPHLAALPLHEPRVSLIWRYPPGNYATEGALGTSECSRPPLEVMLKWRIPKLEVLSVGSPLSM